MIPRKVTLWKNEAGALVVDVEGSPVPRTYLMKGDKMDITLLDALGDPTGMVKLEYLEYP
jgi:hypothetical protein